MERERERYCNGFLVLSTTCHLHFSVASPQGHSTLNFIESNRDILISCSGLH